MHGSNLDLTKGIYHSFSSSDITWVRIHNLQSSDSTNTQDVCIVWSKRFNFRIFYESRDTFLFTLTLLDLASLFISTYVFINNKTCKYTVLLLLVETDPCFIGNSQIWLVLPGFNLLISESQSRALLSKNMHKSA